MVAIHGRIRPDASTNTEFVVGDELGPLVELLFVAKDVTENQSSDRITVSLRKYVDNKCHIAGVNGQKAYISTMVVELSTFVSRRNVDLGKVSYTSNLDIIRCFDPMDTSKGSGRDDARPVIAMSAITDLLSFGITNKIYDRWSPYAEIIYRVEPCITPVRQYIISPCRHTGPRLQR
jgi:hypothetical protein